VTVLDASEPASSRLDSPPKAKSLLAAVPEIDSRKKLAMRALSELPPFSPLLNRLLASLADESASIARLADLIETDPVLAGNMLSLANSALYARRSLVNSVRDAVSLLGISKIRNAALGMSIAGMWSRVKVPPSWSMKAFDLHSAATAVLADQIALEGTVEYPEGAFAAGLLHDLGRLLIATALPQEFVTIEKARAETGAPLTECELAVLDFIHAELSELALDAWHLPPPIVKAAGTHHHPWPAATSGSGELPLGQVIAAADKYVNSMGISISESTPPPEPDLASVLALGLPLPRVEKLLTTFENDLAALAPLIR
jgi:HD-like signal output (HDOD) protein